MYRKLFLIGTMLLASGAGLLLLALAFQASPTYAQSSEDWEFLDGPYSAGGTVSHLALTSSAPDRVYAVVIDQGDTRYRLHRSDNGGASWTAVYTMSATISALAVDPTRPDVLYLGGAEQCLRSADGGLTWAQVYTVGQYIVIDPLTPTTIYAGGIIEQIPGPYGDMYGVAKSIDDGVTWAAMSPIAAGYLQAMTIHPVTTSIIYAGGADLNYRHIVYRSNDGGLTWSLFWPPESHYYRGHVGAILLHKEKPETIYLDTERGSDIIFRSRDGGATWSELGALSGQAFVLALDLQNPHIIYAAQASHASNLYKSLDGGDTWWISATPLPEFAGALAVHPTQTDTLFAGLAEQGIYQSKNGGSSWNPANEGIRSLMPVRTLAYDPVRQTIWAGSGYKQTPLYKLDRDGVTWTMSLQDGHVFDLAARPVTPSIVYAVADNKLYVSENNGQDWNVEAWDSDIWLTGVAPDPLAPQRAYAIGYTTNPWSSYFLARRENEWGNCWWQQSLLPGLLEPTVIAVYPTQPGAILVGGMSQLKDSVLLRSEDSGVSWTPVLTLASSSGFSEIVFDPGRPETVYVGEGMFHGVYKSADGGKTWIEKNGNLANVADASRIFALTVDALGAVYRATNAGLYRSADGGESWALMDAVGLLAGRINALDVQVVGDRHYLLAGAETGGVWRYLIADLHYKTYLPLVLR